MNKTYFSLILLTTFFILSKMTQAHGPIPMPLEAINKILDRQLPPKIDSTDKDVTGFPTVINDINALNSKDRSTRNDAYKRLIDRGDKATPEILIKISDSATNLLEKKQLIYLLGYIKTPGTDKDIIAFTEMLRGLDSDVRKIELKTVYFQTFRSLSKYSDTSAAIEYANTLLNDKNIEPEIHSQALFFLADQNAQGAEEWINIYNKANISIEEQYALIYLSGKLGTRSGIQETINFLLNLPKSQSSYKYETHKILDNLTYKVDSDELLKIISTIINNNARFYTDKKINSYPLLSDLYRGKDEVRSNAALALLNGWSNDKDATMKSLKYMISINDTAPYVILWKLHHPVLVRFVNHIGYEISFSNDSARFIEIPKSYSYQAPNPDILVDSLMNSFKKNDIDYFKSSLFPDENIFESFNNVSLKKGKKQNTNELYGKYKKSAINKWSDIISKASLSNLNWYDVKYKSENRILVDINGAHIAKLTIHIEGGGEKHAIILENCILYNNKWYILSGIKWT